MSTRPPAPPPPPNKSAPPSRLPPPSPARKSIPPESAFEDDTAIRSPISASRPTIALVVSGSIAAYKAAEVARLLLKQGARVLPVMTRSALEFLGPMTLAGLTGEKVVTEMFDASFPGELHIELAQRSDCVVFVPATADLLARLAQGRADDLATALALAAKGPVLAAPAMHPRMWAHPSTQRNVATLGNDGRVELVGPVLGEVASNEVGVGRMAEPEIIASAAMGKVGRRDLAGLRVVVSAGPTLEDFDPVRFLGNRSTGKMGFAVAERAAARGAEVTLIAGPVTLPTPFGVRRIDVRSAVAMRGALWQTLGPELKGADALVMTAAVADYRPAEERASKMKRTGESMKMELLPNPDLLAEIGAARTSASPVLVGFAVETDADDKILAAAHGKLDKKRVDFVVANSARESFGKDDNRAFLVSRGGDEPLGVLSKKDLADRILDRVLALHRR